MPKNILSSIFSTITILYAAGKLPAAQFDVLGYVSRPYGEKSVIVSDDGSTVLAARTGVNLRDGFLWSTSSGITIVYPRDTYSSWPLGMSGNGQLVVGAEGGTPYNSPATYKYDASADGSVVVGYQSFGYPNGEAFRTVSGGSTIFLGEIPGGYDSSVATAVSADGNTVVGWSSNSDWAEPFRWTASEEMVALGALPGATKQIGQAWDVSGDGNVVVGRASSGPTSWEAFRWTPITGMQSLGDLPGGFVDSTAFDVSDDGSVIVGESFATQGRRAFIWTATAGMRQLSDVLQMDYGLDLHGVTLGGATSISADGRVIVGWGSDGTTGGDVALAWRVELNAIPEPSTTLLWLVAALPISLRRRRITA